MLTYCRESFEALLQTPLTEEKKIDEKEEDRQERDFKTKHKLFGNIEFVGELFKQMLVTDLVMSQVFSSLLGIGQESDLNVNDNTIEAGLRLISKLGPTLEKNIIDTKEEDKREKLKATVEEIFDRLKQLETLDPEDPKNRASLRIKILVKNMFADRKAGWLKAREDDKKIQTKQ
jgi:hypothetical protein